MIFRILIVFFSYPVNPVDPVKVLRSGIRASPHYEAPEQSGNLPPKASSWPQ